MAFADKLQKLRKENGLSQEQLAMELNVSRQAISKWELGTLPDVENLIHIASFFECPIQDLLEDEIASGVVEVNKKSKFGWLIAGTIIFLIMFIGVLVIMGRKPEITEELPITRLSMPQEIHYTEKKDIERFLNENGLEPDDKVLEIYQIIQEVDHEQLCKKDGNESYYIKDKEVYTYIDTEYILGLMGYPAGDVCVTGAQGVHHTLSNEHIKYADVLTGILGYDVTGKIDIDANWEGSFEFGIELWAYPVYEVVTGELYERDWFFDDNLGEFTAKRVIGMQVIVRTRY